MRWLLVAGRFSPTRLWPPRSSSSHTHCASAGRSPSGSSPADTLSHSVACEFGIAALPLAPRKHALHRLAMLSIRRSPPDTAARDPARGPPDLPTALSPPRCSLWHHATLPKCDFPALRQCLEL